MMLPLAFLLALQTPALPSATPSDNGDPPGRVARLSVREGRVSFQPSGDTAASSWNDAVLNYTLTSGDRLYADQDARAELEAGNCTVRLGAATDLTIANLTDDFLQVSMSSGTLRVTVYDLSHGDSIEVDTPNGAFLLRQAGAYRVDVSDPDRATTIRVDSGLAEVVAGEVLQSVRGGDALALSGSDPIRVASMAPRPPDDFDRWSAGRDQPLAAVGDCAGLRSGVVSHTGRGGLGAVPRGSLGVDRSLGLDVGGRRALGLRAVSLRPLGVLARPLGVGAGPRRGASVLRSRAGCLRECRAGRRTGLVPAGAAGAVSPLVPSRTRVSRAGESGCDRRADARSALCESAARDGGPPRDIPNR